MAEQLWKGRFSKAVDSRVNDFNSSIRFDQRMIAQDMRGSGVHATMLAKQGIISEQDCEDILNGLASIADDLASGKLEIDPNAEAAPGAGVAQRRKLFCRYVAGRLHEGLSIRRIKGAKVKSECEIFLLRCRIFRVRFLILDNLAYLCAPKQAELGRGPRGLAENRPR